MSFELMAYTQFTPATVPAGALSVADVLAELPVVREALATAHRGAVAARAHAEDTAADWEAALAQRRRDWGAEAVKDAPTPARVGEARDLAEQAAARVAAWTARRATLLVALRERQTRRVVAAGAGIALESTVVPKFRHSAACPLP